jgi:hypothetical protein
VNRGAAFKTGLANRLPFAALFVFASFILVWLSRDSILTRAGWDPDDQLRLVQLRDFLGGQGWFDTTQYRLNPPDGAPMHWSRLVELPLAAVNILTTPWLGTAQAEMVAGTLVPLLYLGGIAFLLAQIAGKIGGRSVAIAACMLALIAPAMLIQLRPMRIDHHGAQIFCAVLGFASLYWHNVRRAGLVLGVALAVWVHISLEGAPMTLAFFLLLGWRWITDAGEGKRLFWSLASFAGSSVLLFFGTQSAGLSAAQYCDTVSPAHLWAIVAATAILLPASHRQPQSAKVRFGLTLLAGVGALALLLWQNPVCAQGAFADLDPLVRSYWYANIREGLPIWEQRLQPAVTLMMPLLAALIALTVAWRITPRDKHSGLAVAGYFLIYGSIVSALVFRTVSVATAFTIVPLAICLVAAFERYRTERRLAYRLMLVPAALMLVAPGMILGPLAAKSQKGAPTDDQTADGKSKANALCGKVGSVAALAALPKSNIAAPFNLGPAILLVTPHSVLASSHHRNRSGMRDQIDLFRLPSDQAKAIIDRRQIRYLVTCPDEAEIEQYTARAPDGLWAQIDAGRLPSWLAYGGTLGKGLMVWEVR